MRCFEGVLLESGVRARCGAIPSREEVVCDHGPCGAGSKVSGRLGRMPHTVGVVINVGTDLVATLALASLRRHGASVPVRLMNCEPSAASRSYFDDLAIKWGFEVVEETVRPHGQALDDLFRSTDSELILLLDSDAEILDHDLVPRCISYFSDERVFGAGFVHSSEWMGEPHGYAERVGYYQERAWLPFVVFRVAMIQEALRAGLSFGEFTHFNDLAASQRLSRLAAGRLRVGPYSDRFSQLPLFLQRRLTDRPLNRLACLRRDFYGQRPNFVYYDTGASIYQYCKFDQNWIFAGMDARICAQYVSHYHGISRHAVYGHTQTATRLESVRDAVRNRLRHYGLEEGELPG